METNHPRPKRHIDWEVLEVTLFVLVGRTKMAAIVVLEARKCVEELVEVGILSGNQRNR